MKFVMNSCDRILVLNFGEKIFEGTPDEVKVNKEVQSAYFGRGLVAGEALK
jgi:branched-chain amino acid transport system ATP-binding protein